MKYWGKKPHNIWAAYIERYCPEGGTVLDPFVGSGVAAFEAASLGRKALAFDLNPMSAFTIEALASIFDEDAFLAAVDNISTAIESDPLYREHYLRGRSACVFNYRWYRGQVVDVAIENADGSREVVRATSGDRRRAAAQQHIDIPFWTPTESFPQSPAITHKFVRDLGGDTFAHLWTRRNLYVLAKVFNFIRRQRSPHLRLQLLFGFAQTLHLSCRMVYPRGAKANRDFSGSWGRPDYMIRRKSMEQNPLVVFRRSCLDKQGVRAAMHSMAARFRGGLKIADVTTTRRLKKSCDINYGIVDVADLGRYVPDGTVDFVITDPPYAGLVRYLPLSLVWLVWLKKYDARYTPDLNAEITISDERERPAYRRRLQNAFKQIYPALKPDGRLVVTFHHKEMREWNDFVNAVHISGFTFDKVIHQYNKRSGESNVAMPYGTSATDFYIRCVKNREIDFTRDESGFDHFILRTAIDIIAVRNEPTPFNFIFDGLVPELLQAGYIDIDSSTGKVEQTLQSFSGDDGIFLVTPNKQTKAGDFWWFRHPEQHISYPDRPLQERMERSVLALLRRQISVQFDDVLAELFRSYPNGLTPDIRSLGSVLKKYAYPSSGRWKIKQSVIISSTEHTEVIQALAKIGAKAGYDVHIGKRERGEQCEDGTKLAALASLDSLDELRDALDAIRTQRVEMMDVVFVSKQDKRLKCALEVENTTMFMGALQRGSNISARIPKLMVVPDDRLDELLGIPDPLFRRIFQEHNWRYMTYSDVTRLSGYSKPSLAEFHRLGRAMEG